MAGAKPAEPEPPPARVTFFFGAGASKGAGVPLTREFVPAFGKKIAADQALGPAYDRIVGLLAERERSGEDPSAIADVEATLSALDTLTSTPLPIAALFDRKDIGVQINQSQLLRLREQLEAFIRESCIVDPERTKYLQPFLRFIRDYGTVRVFTTNYDIVLEQFFRLAQVRWTDGFKLRWEPDELIERESVRAYIYKLQGSVTWFHTPLDGFVSLPLLTGADKVTLLSGEKPRSVILYPARKEGFAGPLVELLGKLQSESLLADYLISVGYSFRDERFRRLFLDAGAIRRGLRLILLSPDADGIYRTHFEVDDTSQQDPNSTPSSGGIFGGRVLKLPLKFEESFMQLVTFYLPTFIRASRAEDAAVSEANAGQSVDWSQIAMDYASIGFLDPLPIIESVSPLFADNRLKRIRYDAYKAFGLALHNSPPLAGLQWQSSVEGIRSLLGREDPVSIYDRGSGQGLSVQLNLHYPTTVGERASQMHVALEDMLSLANDLIWFSKLYANAMVDGPVKSTFQRLADSVTRFRSVLQVFTEPIYHARSLASYLDLREQAASGAIREIRESLRAHSPINQGDPADPTKRLIVALESRLYSEACDAMRDALPVPITADSAEHGTVGTPT